MLTECSACKSSGSSVRYCRNFRNPGCHPKTYRKNQPVESKHSHLTWPEMQELPAISNPTRWQIEIVASQITVRFCGSKNEFLKMLSPVFVAFIFVSSATQTYLGSSQMAKMACRKGIPMDLGPQARSNRWTKQPTCSFIGGFGKQTWLIQHLSLGVSWQIEHLRRCTLSVVTKSRGCLCLLGKVLREMRVRPTTKMTKMVVLWDTMRRQLALVSAAPTRTKQEQQQQQQRQQQAQ